MAYKDANYIVVLMQYICCYVLVLKYKIMGKEKLEWFRYQQKRMGDYWCDIKEYQHKCPLCGGKLFLILK